MSNNVWLVRHELEGVSVVFAVCDTRRKAIHKAEQYMALDLRGRVFESSRGLKEIEWSNGRHRIVATKWRVS